MKNASRPGRSRRESSGDSSEPPPTDDPKPTGDVGPAQVAEYVATMAAELAELARGSKLDFVARLLDMARVAAVEAAGQVPRPQDPGR